MAKDIIYHPSENGDALYAAIYANTGLARIRPEYDAVFLQQPKKEVILKLLSM